jgi:hypothetical protein
MSIDPIARLAAANPVPTGAVVQEPAPFRLRPRRTALALALAAAVAIPAAAFADRLGDLLGISNEGTPVATTTLPFSHDTKLAEAMQELGFPSTLQLLGTVNRVSFYASRRADGHYCFAIAKDENRGGVSCDLDGTFPSPTRPVWIFPPHDGFNGFAADGVATVEGVDASGRVVVSAPVTQNLFAAPSGEYTDVATVEALDAGGRVIWTWHVPDR